MGGNKSEMSYHPINLALRFLLELTVLFAAVYWGWVTSGEWSRYLWAIFLPLILAAVWGIFAVPHDPSRSGKTVVAVPGWTRLVIELFFFALGFWFIHGSIGPLVANIFSVIVFAHYVVSYERIKWLLKQS